MKNAIIVVIILFFTINVQAQTFDYLANIKFNSPEDYVLAENTVKKCSDFILTTPADPYNIDRADAMRFILRWMDGTPDYSFDLDEHAMGLTQNDAELMTVYFSSLVKAALENKDKNNDERTAIAVDHFLDYCANSDNKVRKNKEIKKLLKERSS
jgi:hypothetical protein